MYKVEAEPAHAVHGATTSDVLPTISYLLYTETAVPTPAKGEAATIEAASVRQTRSYNIVVVVHTVHCITKYNAAQ